MERTEKSSKAAVATELIVGDRIEVVLAAQHGGSGERKAVAQSFNHLGEAVDVQGKSLPGTIGLELAMLSGAAAPEFPLAKYQELIATGQIEGAEDLKEQYQMALEQFESGGGLTIEDRIGNSALDWADKAHGVKQIDGNHFVIKPDQVAVRGFQRSTPEQPGIFTVQLTPVWG